MHGNPCAAIVGVVLVVFGPALGAEMPSLETPSLAELARQEFGTLTKAEEKLFEAVEKGVYADYRSGSDQEDDPARVMTWGVERTLNGEHLAWLCMDRRASGLVPPRGIRVMGARINGELNLTFAKVSFPMFFEKCVFPGGIDISHAEILSLYLDGTHIALIAADNVKVNGILSLCDGFKAYGEVHLIAGSIGKDLDCGAGQFVNPGGSALSADGLRIDGSVFLGNGFAAEGEVRFPGAIVGGHFNCLNGKLLNKGACALVADWATVRAHMLLGGGFRSEGEVQLSNATLGELDCTAGQFINPNGYGLKGDAMKVTGSVFLCKGFRAEGTVSLGGASIGGQLNCIGGEFITDGGHALAIDTAKVKGHVLLCNGFRAEGAVSLAGVEIEGYLVWRGIASPASVTLDLSSAKIGTLFDDPSCWPLKGKLLVHGLVYQEFADAAPRDARVRIEWLHRQPSRPFRPQPYEQLAAVLRSWGRDDDAKRVLIAKEEDRGKYTKMRLHERYWHRLLGLSIGYGYRPWRALWFMMGIIATGCLLFGIGSATRLITPSKGGAYVADGGGGQRLADDYPKFNAFIYAIDMFVPVLDLHVANYWLPNANRGRQLLRLGRFKLRCGGLLRLYLWIHILAGWVLTTMLVVGVTWYVRR